MGKGKRYDNEPKLNYTKVFAVAIAIIVLIIAIIAIKNILLCSISRWKMGNTWFRRRNGNRANVPRNANCYR